jgi:hypothetical protein
MKTALIRSLAGPTSTAVALSLTAIAVFVLYLLSEGQTTQASARFALAAMPVLLTAVAILIWKERPIDEPDLASTIASFGLFGVTTLLLLATLAGYCRLT